MFFTFFIMIFQNYNQTKENECSVVYFLQHFKLLLLHSMVLLMQHFGRRIGKQKTFFVDDEGTKHMKRMITLFMITSQFIPQNRHRSEQLRKQMLNNMYGQQMLILTDRIILWFYIVTKKQGNKDVNNLGTNTLYTILF